MCSISTMLFSFEGKSQFVTDTIHLLKILFKYQITGLCAKPTEYLRLSANTYSFQLKVSRLRLCKVF